jgi:hypothetical protein
VLRNGECARAYLNDGCEYCDSYFTSMSPGGGVRSFPSKWKDSVSSLILRKGCQLSLTVQGSEDDDSMGNNGTNLQQMEITNIHPQADNGTVLKNLVQVCQCIEKCQTIYLKSILHFCPSVLTIRF